ncbi:MAG: pilus assembly protein MshD [Betaproteobacteria bacterium]|nr:pilus assembly protein MshD [Betaproteobacteria bacterium]
MCTERAARGFSLVEAVMFILVVSIALVVLVQAYVVSTTGLAEPVIRRQTLAIAQALMEEIQLKDFANPSGGYAGPYSAATRSQFDDVMDYNGLALTGISDLTNTPIVGLSGYNASISVSAAAFGNVPLAAGWRILVTVTNPNGGQVTLEGYKADA